MRFIDLPLWAMDVVSTLLLLVCAALMICMLQSAQQKETRRYILWSLPAFLASFILTAGTEGYRNEFQPGKHATAWAMFIARVPVWAFAAVFALSIAAAGCAWTYTARRLRRSLTVQSICEGLDQLPDGVAYSADNGVPLLVNIKMHEICTAAIGAGMTDSRYLQRRLANGELHEGCRLERNADGTHLLLGDGTVWDLRERKIRTRFGAVTELLAFNITDFYRGNEELRQRNSRLAAVNARLRDYTGRLNKIVRGKEILAAKIRLHDDLGSAVLAIRAYLSQPNGSRDTLLPLLKTPVFLIGCDEDPDDGSGDLLTALENAAAAIGMKIVFDGTPPEKHRELLAVAIHECLTNTVKHANGSRLTVKSRCADGRYETEITNDGAPPSGDIKKPAG